MVSWVLCAVLCVTGAGLGFLMSVLQDKLAIRISAKKKEKKQKDA